MAIADITDSGTAPRGSNPQVPDHRSPDRSRLAGLARACIARPKTVLLIALLFTVIGGVLAGPLSAKLSSGGFTDPSAESSRAAQQMVEHFGLSGMQMVFTVTSDDASGAAATAAGTTLTEQLQADPDVVGVRTPWPISSQSALLISTDGRIGAVIVDLRGSDDEAMKSANRLAAELAGTSGNVQIAAGGQALAYYDVNTTATEDVSKAEMITLPISLVLLVLLLRSFLSAAIPVIGGIVAIATIAGFLSLLTMAAEVSVFALNVTVALGLALAIDYSLLIISRFREYLDEGAEVEEAIVAAASHSGRAVVFSGITVALSIAGALFFPMSFLKSMAVAGIAVVLLSIVIALTCVPALLALFGARIARRNRPVEDWSATRFYRIARFAQRRAIAVTLAVVALLLALGSPILGLKLSLPDDRVLSGHSRVGDVGDDLREHFATNFAGTIDLVLPDIPEGDHDAVQNYLTEISALPGVQQVAGEAGLFVDGSAVQTGEPAPRAYYSVATTFDPFSDHGDRLLTSLHEVTAPVEVLVGGLGQQNRDAVAGISAAIPYALAWIVASTFILITLMTGSVVLGAKAIVMNLLSLTATFGSLVWIFQDGHLGGLGAEVTGAVIATIPILMFCISFGLSMDYEVFLLSRFKEGWEASGKTRADNDEAVALGIARSGRVITAAAAVMIIVFAGITMSEVSLMRMFGFGLALAILIDATLVRLLLVPAVMRLAGTWNWWSPAFLRPLLSRLAITH